MSDGAETLPKRWISPVRSGTPRLIVVDSPDREAIGRAIEPTYEGFVLGREGTEPIRDPRMSRQHARVSAQNDGIHVTDLGGANGTFCGGVAIEKAILTPNAVLSLGDTLIVLDGEPDPDDLPAQENASDRQASEVVGISAAAVQLRRSIATVARSKGSVLLLGATGTGKEIAAREIHRLSGRSGPFVAVNCAAIPAGLAEAELFGYRKGAFTGAEQDKDGFLAGAAGGTLFLDEVGDLPSSVQAKLLRVLEDGVVRALGGLEETRVDLRVVAATNVDLHAAMFRSDLLARLGDWVLRLPPLARRKADILILADHFFRAEGRPSDQTTELAEALLLYDWPANIRELKKIVLRLVQLAPAEGPIDLHLLPAPLQAPLRARLEEAKGGGPPADQLERLMRASRGNVTAVAQQQGWHRTQLYRWLRRAGIAPEDYR